MLALLGRVEYRVFGWLECWLFCRILLDLVLQGRTVVGPIEFPQRCLPMSRLTGFELRDCYRGRRLECCRRHWLL